MTASTQKTMALTALNADSAEACAAKLAPLVDGSPWVLRAAAENRPFASVTALGDALEQVIRNAPRERKLALIRAHPVLAGKAAIAGGITPESSGEQRRLGLLNLSQADHASLATLNQAYLQRFDMPFILALSRQPDLAAVFREIRRRLTLAPAEELDNAIAEVIAVVRARTRQMIG